MEDNNFQSEPKKVLKGGNTVELTQSQIDLANMVVNGDVPPTSGAIALKACRDIQNNLQLKVMTAKICNQAKSSLLDSLLKSLAKDFCIE